MKVRILSGIVLVIIMASALFCGSWYLYLLCLGISLIGMYELYRVIGKEKSLPAAVGYLSSVLYYASIVFGYERYSMLVIVFCFMAVMSIYVFTFPKYKSQDVMLVFFGLIYVTVMLSYICKVRMMEDGIYIVWLIFITSWINDTFAYFTGVFLGKHKMAPVLSPKKSVEGAIGGIVGATVLGAVYGYFVSSHMSGLTGNPVITFAAAGLAGAILAIVGDLAASAIKRDHNIKDYGKLIPGHGGIMDRFDSVIFTAPAVYWAVFIIQNFVA